MALFSIFYEFFENIFGFYNANFSIVFQNFYQSGGYNSMGLILLFIPLLVLLLFYFGWTYPYGTKAHWFLTIFVIALIVAGSTYGATRSALESSLTSTENIADFASLLSIKYSVLNGFLSLLVSFLYSLGLRPFSKVQMNLPF